MRDKYLLSICIPTYNRAPYLKKCLDSLVCQPEFLQGNVEIVISDNASTDNTRDLVSLYQTKYENIIYHRNDTNMKVVNFAVVMQLGHGILRKLGGDIRVYKKGSLKYFCDISRKWKRIRPVIYFNNGDIRGKVQEEEEITTMDRFLECASFKLTWIDTFCLWEEDCKDLVTFAQKSQKIFWFVEKTLELMKQKGSAIFFNQRVIKYMAVKQKNVSYGIFDVFYNQFLGICKSLLDEKIITQRRFAYLEKDLLFGFFINSILNWEINHDKFQYSKTENLKKTVWDQYQEKPYFQEFEAEYSRKFFWGKMKRRIKDVPIFGVILVKMKHGIERWG